MNNDIVSDLIKAVKNKELVAIVYEGDTTISGGPRVIEPLVIGSHRSTRNLVLRAWQVRGATKSGVSPGWHLFRVDMITNLKPSNKKFLRPRPLYNATGDRSMGNIVAQAKF